MQLGELLAREQRARHMGLSQVRPPRLVLFVALCMYLSFTYLIRGADIFRFSFFWQRVGCTAAVRHTVLCGVCGYFGIWN